MNDYYNNNPALKRGDSSIQFDVDKVEEITKCMTDAVYFMSNYITIISLDEGRIKFKPYPFQKQLVDDCVKHKFNIFTVERQSGKCLNKNVSISVRNKQTGEHYELPIGEFYEQRRLERDMHQSKTEN